MRLGPSCRGSSFSGGTVSQSELQEFHRLFVLEHVSLVQVLQHISIALDKNLRVLLAMAKLLISITLNALEEV